MTDILLQIFGCGSGTIGAPELLLGSVGLLYNRGMTMPFFFGYGEGYDALPNFRNLLFATNCQLM